MKAIASGNPAVLVLAETDAELQRLAVLRRNHADEQYLARRNLRELPQTIERLEKRIASLDADMKTVEGGDEGIITVGGRNVRPQEPAMANALNRIPDLVDYTRKFPIGTYRGLTFGIERDPFGGGDVYLEGQTYRRTSLSKDSQGPRAVMNGLNRIIGSYAEERERAEQEKALAERQFGDYEERLGKPFLHTAYMDEMTALRDQLKLALSAPPTEEGRESGPSTAELAEKIKALRSSHAVEAAPARLKTAEGSGKTSAPRRGDRAAKGASDRRAIRSADSTARRGGRHAAGCSGVVPAAG